MINKNLEITMPDCSIWSVPVIEIAKNRAQYYAYEFGGDIERSLTEDTIPLFESDEYEIIDWASENMNWVDIEEFAVCIKPPTVDYQEGWLNGNKKVTTTTYNKFWATSPEY